MRQDSGLALGVVAASAFLCVAAGGQEPATLDIRGGLNYLTGDVTYDIGGQGWSPSEGFGRTRDKISQLEWPLGTLQGVLGVNSVMAPYEFDAELGVVLSGSSGVMKDSDYGERSFPERVTTTYSESPVDLSGVELDVRGRWWLIQDSEHGQFSFAAGVGLLWQKLSWKAMDTVQWYPQEPELGVEELNGTTITYDSRIIMPYFELAAGAEFGGLRLLAVLDYAPLLRISDRDDHVLRYILEDTDADGSGWRLAATGAYTMDGGWFVYGRLATMNLTASGMERDTVYGGPNEGNYWELEHRIVTTQTTISAGVGCTF